MTTEKQTVTVVRGTYYDRENDEYVGNGCDRKQADVPVDIIERAPWKFSGISGAVSTSTTEEESGGEDEGESDFDTEEFLDRPWNAVASDVKSGGYDDLLDQISAAEKEGRDRNSVHSSIEERQEGS